MPRDPKRCFRDASHQGSRHRPAPRGPQPWGLGASTPPTPQVPCTSKVQGTSGHHPTATIPRWRVPEHLPHDASPLSVVVSPASPPCHAPCFSPIRSRPNSSSSRPPLLELVQEAALNPVHVLPGQAQVLERSCQTKRGSPEMISQQRQPDRNPIARKGYEQVGRTRAVCHRGQIWL